MKKFVKDGGIKLVENQEQEDILRSHGWLEEGEFPELDRDVLLAKAEELGIKIHHKAKAETIAKAIAEHDNS